MKKSPLVKIMYHLSHPFYNRGLPPVLLKQMNRNQKKKEVQTKISLFQKINTTMSLKYNKALAYSIAVDMLPYSIVEKQGFQHFVRCLQPGYEMPSRKTITEKYVPELYLETKNTLEGFINQAKYVSLSTDCWTSVANMPYIGITAHFIDENWILRSCCLACRKMTEDHTGENIRDMINEILIEWKINLENVVACTTDYGSNMVSAINLSTFQHICCFGHALNTGVSK